MNYGDFMNAWIEFAFTLLGFVIFMSAMFIAMTIIAKVMNHIFRLMDDAEQKKRYQYPKVTPDEDRNYKIIIGLKKDQRTKRAYYHHLSIHK